MRCSLSEPRLSLWNAGYEVQTDLIQTNLVRQVRRGHCIRVPGKVHTSKFVRPCVACVSMLTTSRASSVRYSHIMSPRQSSADNARKMSERTTLLCIRPSILRPIRSPTMIYARAKSVHSMAYRLSETPNVPQSRDSNHNRLARKISQHVCSYTYAIIGARDAFKEIIGKTWKKHSQS